jgi:hypothetical protein
MADCGLRIADLLTIEDWWIADSLSIGDFNERGFGERAVSGD